MADNIQNNSAEVQQAVTAALEDQKKKKKKKRLIILAVIAGVILLFIVIGIAGGSDDDKPSSNGVSVSQPADDKEEQKPSDGESNEQPTDGKVKPGDVITIDNDLEITFVSCDTNFKKYSKYAKPDKGNKVVRAEFKFKNISSDDTSLSSFTCYADDKKCDEFYSVDDYNSPTLESISAGRSLTAVVYYQVPEKSENIELEYESNMWTDEKIVFELK